jgi:hypothetical protein
VATAAEALEEGQAGLGRAAHDYEKIVARVRSAMEGGVIDKVAYKLRLQERL